MYDSEAFFGARLEALQTEGRYRYFADLERRISECPNSKKISHCELHQQRAATLKRRLAGCQWCRREAIAIPALWAIACSVKAASDKLLRRHGIYVQLINYSTRLLAAPSDFA
jgi:7-keto-8-aminopelargonate synthetase-like enzyme